MVSRSRRSAGSLAYRRKVVRKVIRSEATEFRYERETQPLPKMGPWSTELDRLLVANESKAARERLTLIRLFEELRGLGYAGGYDAVRRYARRWSQERGASTTSAYVPLSFEPGEAYQFDWSHEVVLLSGVTVIVKAAHVRLCHSRMLFVRAYPRPPQRGFLLWRLSDAGRRTCGGVPQAAGIRNPSQKQPFTRSGLLTCLTIKELSIGAARNSR